MKDIYKNGNVNRKVDKLQMMFESIEEFGV